MHALQYFLGITNGNPCYDLLASDKFSNEFVVETEADGISYLRLAMGLEEKAACRNKIQCHVQDREWKKRECRGKSDNTCRTERKGDQKSSESICSNWRR